jgi:DNA gyrase subunit B
LVRSSAAEQLFNFFNGKGKEGLNVQRYKGLGKMNPEQLWASTMDPSRRRLVRVVTEDEAGVDQIFTILIGNDIRSRRPFIQENPVNVRNLDI